LIEGGDLAVYLLRSQEAPYLQYVRFGVRNDGVFWGRFRGTVIDASVVSLAHITARVSVREVFAWVETLKSVTDLS
jgi:hypothetical protein